MMRRLLLACLGLCLALPAVAQEAGTWTIGPYRLQLRVGKEMQLSVFRDGRLIHQVRNARIWVNPASMFVDFPGSADDDETKRPHAVGTDVLGLGMPTVVVQQFTGGAHCCFKLSILSLGDKFRALPTIDLLDAETVRFKKLGDRSALAMSTVDFSFHYWRAPFAFSSAAPIVLGYDPIARRYVADPALMRAPLPSADALATLSRRANAEHRKVIAEGGGYVPPELTQPILDLIYTGHLQEARQFLEQAWAAAADEREDYWSDLTRCQLRKSQYWPAVAKLNDLPPDRAQCAEPR